MTDGFTAWTREGNLHAPHIQRLVRILPRTPGGWTHDGELVLPKEEFSFQQTQSAVAAENENSIQLEYHVFDAHNSFSGGPTFRERMRKRTITVETHPVSNLEEVEYWYNDFLKRGYEGLIFRTDTPYLFGSGARSLMKQTPTQRAEFTIIGVWEGTGKNAGVPVYRLARPDVPYVVGAAADCKNSFGAVPKGDYDEKRRLWAEHGDGSVNGKSYTVEFRERYESGVPQFPIGIGVRDYE